MHMPAADTAFTHDVVHGVMVARGMDGQDFHLPPVQLGVGIDHQRTGVISHVKEKCVGRHHAAGTE